MRNRPIDDTTIQAAVTGNSAAMETILEKYESYMVWFMKAKKFSYDQEDIQEVKLDLLKAVRKWKPLALKQS